MNTLTIINTLLLIAIIFCIWHLTDLIKSTNKLAKDMRDYSHNASSFAERASNNITALMSDFGKLLNNLKKEEKNLKANHIELTNKIEGIVSGFNSIAKEMNDYILILGKEKDVVVVDSGVEAPDIADNKEEK